MAGGTADHFGLVMPSPELGARYRADGWWDDDTFGLFVARCVAADRGRRIRVFSDEHPATTTAGAVADHATAIAGGLAARGVGPGQIVVYQLPNWAETIAVLWAGFQVGAVMVPIIHFYGPNEVGHILRETGARTLVTVDRFGPVDHLSNLAGIRDTLPDLEQVVVVGDESRAAGTDGGTGLATLADHAPLDGPRSVDPDTPVMIGYTSGTTAAPKGVIHTHRTLLAEVRQLAALNPSRDRASVMASPLAHMTGMLGGTLVPMQVGNPVELIDRWDPGRVLEIMVAEDLGPGGGATVFLTGLLDHPAFGPEHLARMPTFGLGGAPIPAAVAERAAAMGIGVYRAYGSTEHPSITGSPSGDPERKRTHTDGRAMAGVEIRVVDDDGRPVAAGEAGHIWSRGPDLFVGYTDPELSAAAIDADGWYHTGDIGVLDGDGYLTISDRASDMIIRGGTNISPAEIEEHLARMDGVAEVAVVGAPDDRLGERACAVVRARPGVTAPDLTAVQAHLAEAAVPRQKWPEQVHVVADMPRTPSGKIRKTELRRILAESDTRSERTP